VKKLVAVMTAFMVIFGASSFMFVDHAAAKSYKHEATSSKDNHECCHDCYKFFQHIISILLLYRYM
ncbi:hypothetical protein ACT453_53020, partial [Bacillus sp. D-CC]